MKNADGQHYGADYLRPVTIRRHLKLTVKFLTEFIRASKIKFDTIVFRGQSGSLVAPIVSVALNKHVLFIRKDSDNNHSTYCVEGNIAINRYIIIDDFISTGATIRKILARIEKLKEDGRMTTKGECVGIFCYAYYSHPERCEGIPCYAFSLNEQDNIIYSINGTRIPDDLSYNAFVVREKAAGRKPTFKKWVNSPDILLLLGPK